MFKSIKTHFPATKSKWKQYFLIFYPMTLGALLFALNGFVDNFMVGQVEQGTAALGAANSWTNILNGIFMGTMTSGAIILAQFYNADDGDRVKRIARLRYLISIISASVFIIFALIIPEMMATVFLKPPAEVSPSSAGYADYIKNYNSWKLAIDKSALYMRINCAQWLLAAITFTNGSMLREIGKGQVAFYWSIITLGTNITFNAIFMYGAKFGVEGAALASVISRVVELALGVWYITKNKLVFGINPLSLFKIGREMQVIFWKRWFNFVAVASVNFFITFRVYFYDMGYPMGSLGVGVAGVTVTSLTMAINGIFLSSFSAIGAMSAVFVAAPLGKGDYKQAVQNAHELKGFNTTMAACMSVLLFITAACIPFMTFISQTQYDADGVMTFDSVAHLKQVSYSVMVVGFYYPMWIWFSTSLRNMFAGGKGQLGNFIDWMITGPIQLGFLALEMLVIIKHWPAMQHWFWISYALFFTTDFLKLIFIEILYYKSNWAHSIVKEETYQPVEIDMSDTSKVETSSTNAEILRKEIDNK